MNLTSYLIEGLLPEEKKKKVVAVYGGGFKPPTSGHFEVAKQALKENPDIDEFIIYIGGKPRNGISPDESILIWDIYKQYLPYKVEVKYTSVPPIKSIYNYAKEHPDEEVLFIIGAREGNEEDFKDIASRTTTLDKYPNLNLRTIVTQGGVSGTAARNASKISLEKFKPFVPSELSDEEVEQVFNIVADKITENITEGKQVGTLYHYTSTDGLKGILQSNSIRASKEYYLGNDINFVSFTRNKNFHKKGSAFDVKIDYRITLDGDKLSNKYKIKPFAYIPGWNYKDNWEYEWLDDEPESVVRDFLQGTGDYDEQEERISFKKSGGSITNIKDYILKVDKVSELTEGRKKKKDPKKGTGKKPEGSKRRLYTDEDPKDGKSSPYGSGYKKLNENITKSQLDALEAYADKLFAKLGIDIEFTRHFLDRANDKRNIKPISIPELMGMFKRLHKKHGKPLSKVDNDFDAVVKDFNSNINIPFAINVTPNDIDLVAKTVMRKKDFKTSTPVISLNENASYSKEINIKEKIAQLTSHMIDKGMNIEPLPTLEFVDGDSENASDFFGKTAYYDPNKQHIVLYTEGRHPKDIVRSYAHEMIHHIQNLEDRLGDVSGTNTTEDDHLDKLEQEANLKGTMTFRNWTDSLNEAVTTQKTEKKKINISFELFDGTKVDEDIILAFSPDSTGIFTLGDNIEKYTGLSKKEAEEYNETTTDAYIYGLVNTMNDGQDIFFFNNGTRLKGQASKLGASVAVIEQIAHEGLHLTRLIIAKTLMGDKFPTGEWPSVGEQDNDSIEEEQLTTALSYVLNQITTPFLEMASNYIPKLSLNEAIVGDKIECDNCDWSWDISSGGDDLYTCHKCWHDNTPIEEKKNKDPFGLNAYARELGQLNEGRYDKSANQFSKIAFEAFKDIHDRGDKEGTFEFSVGPFEEDIYSDQFEFDFEGYVEITDNEYNVDGGANQGFDKKGDEITPLLNLNFKIPKNPTTNPSWEDISFDIKDVVRHELEHLTQGGLNLKGGAWDEDPKLRRPSKQMADDQLIRDLIDADMLPKSQYYKLEKEVDAMLQGLYFKAKKSKRPFKNVINDYLDIFVKQKTISLNDKEDILDLWRSRGKALSLPIFENQKQNMDYKIYSDMDGVLVDFEKGYEKLTGIDLKGEYRPDGENFWKPIEQAGVGYWAGLEWMPDGKQLWSYLKPFNPVLLSAPSRSQSSRIGKHVWVKHKIPGTKLILRYASQKQELATPESILIDDRQVNIDQWRAAGGIGILHTNTANTIQQLQKLGL